MQPTFDRSIVKPVALAQLRERLRAETGLVVDGRRPVMSAAVEHFGIKFNAKIECLNSAACDGVVKDVLHSQDIAKLRTPHFHNGRPSAIFPMMESDADWEIVRPEYVVLRAEDATIRLIPDAPVIFDKQGRVIDDYSSEYWPLLHFYEDAEAALQIAPLQLDGAALVLIDDVWGANYCHWLADWLPRASLVDRRLDQTYVLTCPLTSKFQQETLLACGFSPEKIIPMEPWSAVRATELIVPPYISEVIHPSFRGSKWAMSFVKDVLPPSVPQDGQTEFPERLYLSRGDAPGRRIVNELEFTRLLERYGYTPVTLSGRSVNEQAGLFNSAKFIIAMHGAGLTNILFCPSTTRIVEIFAETYGTLSFWILAASAGNPYATYVADRLHPGPYPQWDNVEIDLEKFEAEVLTPLHGLLPARDRV